MFLSKYLPFRATAPSMKIFTKTTTKNDNLYKFAIVIAQSSKQSWISTKNKPRLSDVEVRTLLWATRTLRWQLPTACKLYNNYSSSAVFLMTAVVNRPVTPIINFLRLPFAPTNYAECPFKVRLSLFIYLSILCKLFLVVFTQLPPFFYFFFRR